MVREFLDSLIRRGILCDEYKRRVEFATTKKDLFTVLCDANGVSFIGELQHLGLAIPYEEFKKEFNLYINGQKIITFPTGYSSKLYIDYTDEITADTTILSCVNCQSDIRVPRNSFPRIVLDQRCNVNVTLETDARLALDYFEGAKYNIIGDQTHVRYTKLPQK